MIWNMKRIYLDNAASTVIDERVLEAMLPYLKGNYGNASSLHSFGQEARQAIDKARKIVADFLNCAPLEIVFTNSATEADNLAILGSQTEHIITTQIEHPAVIKACKHLEKQGVGITYLPVGKEGIIDINGLEKAVKDETGLISIIYANNEIGAIQPIVKIGELIAKLNQNRVPKISFHTDAVQAVNYFNCHVRELGVDLMTLSAHKISGPKGIGVLYIKQGTKIEPIMFGGHQELGLKPGTENVANIVGLGKAIELVGQEKGKIGEIKRLRDKLLDGILEKIPESRLNGSRENRLPNNINMSFKGAEGEAIVMSLDQEGIAASTGSACSSGSLEPSSTLLALGLTPEQAHSSLRLTLGRQTSEDEIDKTLEVLPRIIKRLRQVSGYQTKQNA